jgi:hypothetical protein
MSTRVDPSLGDMSGILDEQQIAQDLHAIEALSAVHLDVTEEALTAARVRGDEAEVIRARQSMIQAFKEAEEAARALTHLYQSRAERLGASLDYQEDRPEVGARRFATAGEYLRQVKANAVNACYNMTAWPDEAWNKVTQRVSNSVTQAVEAAAEKAVDRKAAIVGFAQRIERSLDALVNRVVAVPTQIKASLARGTQAVRNAALDATISVVRWGARQEARVIQGLRVTAALGDAVVKTGVGTVREVAAAVSAPIVKAAESLGSKFTENLAEAHAKRGVTPRRNTPSTP